MKSFLINKKYILFYSLFFYVLTRMIILYCLFNVKYEQPSADARLFYLVGEAANYYHGTVYKDFFFPYPPLALFFAYLPYFASGQNWENFPYYFYTLNLLFDILTLSGIYFFIRKRLCYSIDRQCFIIISYSLVGLIVGPFIFDRIDLAISASLVGMMYFITSRKLSHCIYAYVICSLGICLKIVPAVFLPLLFIYQQYNINNKKWINAIFPWITICLAAAFLYFFNKRTDGGLFYYLTEHTTRGIQVESVWGSIYQFVNIISPLQGFNIVNEFGCQDITSSIIPACLMFTSKYLVFTLIIILFIFLLKTERNNTNDNSIPEKCSCSFLCTCLVLLSFNRVLSPQYFLWLMPFLCIYPAITRNTLDLVLVLILFFLTYLGYVNYKDYIAGNPMIVLVVLCRNLILLFLTFAVFLRSYMYQDHKKFFS